jgi:threonine synthase
MALVYGSAGRLTAQNGGFRPGQGVYDIKKRSLSKTISPSIDILTSSNFERMLHLLCLQAGDGDAGAEVKHGAQDRASPNFMGLDIGIFCISQFQARHRHFL